MFDALFKPNIEKLKAKKNVPALIRALNYKDMDVQKGAAKALGHLGHASAVEPLIEAMKSQNTDMHRVCVEALIQIGGPSVNSLLDLLTEFSHEVNYRNRDAAANALIKIGAPAVGELVYALSWNYRGQGKRIASVLGNIHDPQAAETLIFALKDVNEDVRKTVKKALMPMKFNPGNDSNGAWYWIAKGQFDKCITIGAPAIEPLIFTLNDSDKLTRQQAAKALISIYHSSDINDSFKSMILAKRASISSHKDEPNGGSHEDGRWHNDDGISRSCFRDSSGHNDRKTHLDQGIGVDFRL